MSRALPLLNLVQAALLAAMLVLWPGASTPANVAIGAGVLLFAGSAVLLWISPLRFAPVVSAVCWASIGLGIVFCSLIASSSAYLLTIYGATGQALSLLSLVVMLNVAILFAFIPGHEIAALRRLDSTR